MACAQPPAHWGQRFAGQILEWLPPDTEENFRKCCQDPHKLAYLAEQGWDRPGAITYKLNSHGFRCDEFDSGPYLLALGCSFTIGIGLPVQDTWPYLVGQALDLRVANLGWGGYSNDSCFRLAEYWIPRLKPDCVMMLTAPKNRIEIQLDPSDDQKFEVILPYSESHLSLNDQFIKHWFLNDVNADINQRKNQLALEKLCSNHRVPCIIQDALNNVFWDTDIGCARDFMHPGAAVQRQLADKMLHAWYQSQA